MENETTREIKRYLDVTISGLREELRTEIAGVRLEVAELRTDVSGVRSGLGTEIAGVRLEVADLRTEIRDVRRHSDVVAESLRSEIRLVAEGVAGLDEKFTQEFVNVRAEMREGYDDLKALITASYADLDRRIAKP